jgi:hypothetical protein
MFTEQNYSSHQYAKVEIERRFLLHDIPDDLDPEESYIRIIDLYITHTRLRLRKMETPAGKTVALKLGQTRSLIKLKKISPGVGSVMT